MNDLKTNTFGTFRTIIPSDTALDMTKEEILEYLSKLDESLIKVKEGEEPTWVHFKALKYKEYIEFTECKDKTYNLIAIEVFKRTFLGMSKGNGEIKKASEILAKHPEFAVDIEDGMANLFVEIYGFDSLVVAGQCSLASSNLGKKNKASLV